MLKYFAVIPFLIIEGTLTTIVAGSVSTPTIGFYNVYILFAVVVFADLAGDFIYYVVGKYAGSKILDKIFGWYKISDRRIEQSKISFNKYGGLAIIIGKIIPNFGWPIIILAGSLKMNFFKFLLYVIPVSLIKTAALIAAGYFLGKQFSGLYEYLIVVLVIVIIYILYKFLKFKK